MPVPGLKYSDDELFQLINIVLPCWLLLVLLPGSKLTSAACTLASLVLCALYGALVLPLLFAAPDAGVGTFKDMATLQGVIKLFENKTVLFAGWVHYAVGDLWIGRWVALDALHRRVPRLLMLPILAATLLIMPVGLGAYLLVRAPFHNPKPKRD